LLNPLGNKINCSVTVCLFLLFFSVAVSWGEEAKDDKIRPSVRIAIIPFQKILPESSMSKTVFCPLSGAGYFGGKIAEGAENVVEGLFINKISDFKEREIISVDKVEGMYKLFTAETLKTNLLDILKKLGTELEADEIIIGYIFRYEERIGYDYSVEKPASVAFGIHLFNTKKGSLVWHGVFDKTQKSLMEDVLQISSFYKGGGKWLKARELTKQGIDQIFKTFPRFDH